MSTFGLRTTTVPVMGHRKSSVFLVASELTLFLYSMTVFLRNRRGRAQDIDSSGMLITCPFCYPIRL